jgi:GH15 family glucan-1,4-alpha-glucosidase
MAWVAFDRAIKTAETCGLEAPLEQWKEMREKVHAEVCEKGYNEAVGAFTQYYGADTLDASLLMIPLVGFLPPEDDRVRSTVQAIRRDLSEDGFILRYKATEAGDVDGLSGHEGAFLACSFWMADCLALIGEKDAAHELFERLLSLRNDLGLLAEEYDAIAGRQVGNFPQAFSHVSLVNAAYNLSGVTAGIEENVPDPIQVVRRAMGRYRGRGFRMQTGFSSKSRSGHGTKGATAKDASGRGVSVRKQVTKRASPPQAGKED